MASFMFVPAIPPWGMRGMGPPMCRRTPMIHNPMPVHNVCFHGENIVVTVAKEAVHINKWISGVCHHYRNPFHQLVVGLDTEWLPDLDLKPGDEDHPTATLQLCIGHHCLIIQLLHLDFIPDLLRFFLADPRFLFCGVGIVADVKKLYDNHGLRVGSTSDLNRLNMKVCDRKSFRFLGLKKMALDVMGMEMAKPIEVTLSKWDSKDLGFDQIEYGAIDAYVSSQIAIKLLNSAKSS